MMLSSSWSQQSCLRRYAFFIRGLKDLGDRRWTRHSTWCSILKENSIKGVELTSLETLTFNRGALPHDFLGKHLAVDVSSARTWMSLFNNVRSFFLLSKEGRVPLEGPFVKDISQDHKSSGKFPPGSPLTTCSFFSYPVNLSIFPFLCLVFNRRIGTIPVFLYFTAGEAFAWVLLIYELKNHINCVWFWSETWSQEETFCMHHRPEDQVRWFCYLCFTTSWRDKRVGWLKTAGFRDKSSQ